MRKQKLQAIGGALLLVPGLIEEIRDLSQQWDETTSGRTGMRETLNIAVGRCSGAFDERATTGWVRPC